MKKLKLTTSYNPTGINWDKRQWLISIKEPYFVVLTTGTHKDNSFSGMCLPCETYNKGSYSDVWGKDYFRVLDFDIPFTISND